ncbi:MAG: hypothetical protein HDR15_11050 [Lachnospiraceae bacterium]|nr:hypothetical protein [Lachnospiraceae bacterium]
MKIIIVDDRPRYMWETIEKLKGMPVDEIVMLYFHGKFTYYPDNDNEIKQRCDDLDVSLVQIEQSSELMKQLDIYYAEDDTLIFMDFGLGDTDIFDDRVDIIYAKQKMSSERFPIWFYTGTGERTVARLNRTFNNHTIPTLEFIPQKYILRLDYDYIENEILNG